MSVVLSVAPYFLVVVDHVNMSCCVMSFGGNRKNNESQTETKQPQSPETVTERLKVDLKADLK